MTLLYASFPTPPDHPNDPRFLPRPDYGFNLVEAALKPAPITRKVLMITHDPFLKTKNKTVREYFRWYDSNLLADAYAADVNWCSYGYANYEITERIVVDGYPIKRDAFRYDERSYLEAWQTRQFHQPDGVNYLALVRDFNIIQRINNGSIDEVWLFGHPYGGYYESIMGGQDAFWSNAPALQGTEDAKRRFIIMGFNFERGVGEMLEDLGHHAESMLFKVYENMPDELNDWKRFIKCDKSHPDEVTECGNVHFAPNSGQDYDWGNMRPVKSRCDTWYRYPDLSGDPRTVTCSEWGDGHIRLHHLWWFRHMPHINGTRNGIAMNWWQYIIDPNTIP